MKKAIKQSNTLIIWGAFLFGTLLLCGLIGLGYEGYCLRKALKGHTQQYKIDRVRFEHDVKQLHRSLTTEIQGTQGRLKKLSRQMRSIVPGDGHLWQLYEAQHLLRLANFYSQFYDLKTAVQLMDRADELIYSLHLPRLTNLRAALAQDRTALNLVEQPDLEGVWFTLEGLIKQVPTLALEGAFKQANFKLATSGSGNEQSALKSVKPQDPPTWQTELENTWNTLKSLVKIRRHVQASPQLLSSKDQLLLRNELTILLEQIQMALMRKEATVYRATLLRAKGFLLTFFRSDDPKSQRMIATLEKLAQINVAPQIPTVSKSLTQMERAIALSEKTQTEIRS